MGAYSLGVKSLRLRILLTCMGASSWAPTVSGYGFGIWQRTHLHGIDVHPDLRRPLLHLMQLRPAAAAISAVQIRWYVSVHNVVEHAFASLV